MLFRPPPAAACWQHREARAGFARGDIRAGDPAEITYRPGHEVTVALVLRAMTLEPELLPRLLAAGALPQEARELARRRTTA